MIHEDALPDSLALNLKPVRSTFLNGWKEIAAYIGRGVRTVQRWEALGLPVRRPNSRLRSAVVSTAAEIDAWLDHCGDGRQSRPLTAAWATEVLALRQTIELLRAENELLRQQVEGVQTRHLPMTRPSSVSGEAA